MLTRKQTKSISKSKDVVSITKFSKAYISFVLGTQIEIFSTLAQTHKKGSNEKGLQTMKITKYHGIVLKTNFVLSCA